MNRKILHVRLLCLSAAGYAVMSGSILLMPLPALGVLPGVLFWLGFLAGSAGQVLLTRARVKASPEQRKKRKLPGALVFFSGRAARVVDTALLLLAAVTLIVLTCADESFYGCFVLLAATMFAFCLHCMINGKNYLFVTAQKGTGKKTQISKKGGKVEK